MRPSERAPPDMRDLRDDEAPDYLEAHALVVLAFLDPYDELSLRMRTRLATVGARLGVAVGVIDLSERSLVAEAFDVRAAPMLLVFSGGEVVDRLIGVPPEAILEETVRARLPP